MTALQKIKDLEKLVAATKSQNVNSKGFSLALYHVPFLPDYVSSSPEKEPRKFRPAALGSQQPQPLEGESTAEDDYNFGEKLRDARLKVVRQQQHQQQQQLAEKKASPQPKPQLKPKPKPQLPPKQMPKLSEEAIKRAEAERDQAHAVVKKPVAPPKPPAAAGSPQQQQHPLIAVATSSEASDETWPPQAPFLTAKSVAENFYDDFSGFRLS